MSDTHNLKKEVVLYYKVFGSLAVLTVITVAISNLKLGIVLAVFIALLVAFTKASLVASFFMHLSHEKKLIYLVLLMTAFFFIGMMGLIVFGYYSVPHGTRDLNHDYRPEQSSQAHGKQSPEEHHPAPTPAGGDHH